VARGNKDIVVDMIPVQAGLAAIADIKGLSGDPVGANSRVGEDRPVAIRSILGEGGRHELVVELWEDVFALDLDNNRPGVPYERVVAPELGVHALQCGEAASAGRRLEVLKTAEEFVSVPAGPEGQELTAIIGAVDVVFAGQFHVDIVDS